MCLCMASFGMPWYYTWNDGEHSNVNLDASENIVYFQQMVFSDPIPTNTSGFPSYFGQNFLYFLDISCGDLGVEGAIEDAISIYSNPSGHIVYNDTPSYLTISGSRVFDMYAWKIHRIISKRWSNRSRFTF